MSQLFVLAIDSEMSFISSDLRRKEISLIPTPSYFFSLITTLKQIFVSNNDTLPPWSTEQKHVPGIVICDIELLLAEIRARI